MQSLAKYCVKANCPNTHIPKRVCSVLSRQLFLVFDSNLAFVSQIVPYKISYLRQFPSSHEAIFKISKSSDIFSYGSGKSCQSIFTSSRQVFPFFISSSSWVYHSLPLLTAINFPLLMSVLILSGA